MIDRLSPRFEPTPVALDDAELVSIYDELPLWSAPFGLALLDTVKLRRGIVALDIGCGTGFPVVELAQRLGRSSRVHAVDPWSAALARVRARLRALELANVTLHEGVAEALPLESASVDLIVSNNGLNNVADEARAFGECARVARSGAQLVYAYNLPGSMRELYDAYEAVLRERGLGDEIAAVQAHVFARRKPLAHTIDVLERSGFAVERVHEAEFALRFLDARTMFEHYFVRLAFLPSWWSAIHEEHRAEVFAAIEARLDAQAAQASGLALTIPFACIDARRR